MKEGVGMGRSNEEEQDVLNDGKGDETIRRVERRKTATKRKCGRVKELKSSRVNKACRNIISPDQAMTVTTTANNESDSISRADW